MSHYERYKETVLGYFKTEIGRAHMKEAQKRYFHTDVGQQKNRENRMKSYYKAKIYNDEIKRLNAINLY